MKTIFFTISGIAALTFSSCVNPQTTSGIGQNRFGYKGTAFANTQPTSDVRQGVSSGSATTNRFNRFEGYTQAPTRPTHGSGNTTIAIDSLPTNNSANTVSNDPPANNDVATNNSTTTNSNVTARDKPEYLYGIPVPGRDGMVYSPYNKDAGYIDVRHMKPGELAEDPYTPGKLFRVP